MARYAPTAGDLRYRNAATNEPDLDPFEEAALLREVSHEYLSVLASDNAGAQSSGFLAQVQAEIARRGTLPAQRANRLALISLVVAFAALVVTVLD